MKSGYDGVWLDTFEGKLFNLCDGLGRPVQMYYDFATGSRYTVETYFAALREYVRGVRSRVRQATGRNPVLVANDVAGATNPAASRFFVRPKSPICWTAIVSKIPTSLTVRNAVAR